MAIILKANKVNLFVSSVFFFWYPSPNFLDTPRISALDEGHCYSVGRQITIAPCDRLICVRISAVLRELGVIQIQENDLNMTLSVQEKQ
jgi:hypothetical protein